MESSGGVALAPLLETTIGVSYNSGANLVIPVGTTRTASGAIFGSVTNNGALEVNVPSQTLQINGSLLNLGSTAIINGATLSVAGSVTINGQGFLNLASSSTLTLTGNLTGTTTTASVADPLGTLVFDGTGTSVNPQLLEAMSQDRGPLPAGFNDNFVFGLISLTNNTYVKLVDQSHNTTSAGAECVYADSIIVPAGCTLNLNGLTLYARAVQMAGAAINGTITQIPNAGPLNLATSTPGNLSSPGELDEWTFFERGGRSISITVNPGTTGSPAPVSPALNWAKIQLIDPTGNVLATAETTTSGSVVGVYNILLPIDGTYKIHLTAASSNTAATGNYIISAWDATPNMRSLNIGQQSSGNIAAEYAVDQWTFSANGGQQIQFHLVGISNSGIAFQLAGPDGFVAFKDLSGDSLLIDLPSSGNYTLSAYGLNGDTGTYSFVVDQTSLTPLSLGVVYTGAWAGSGQAQLFSVQVGAGGPLTFKLSDLIASDHTELYARLGSPPTRETFDFSAAGAGSTQSILAPSASAGTWYILAYGESIPSGAGSFTLQVASSDVVLTSVSTAQVATNLTTSATIKGAGFNPGTKVTVVGSDGTAYPVTSTTDLPTQITATFNAGSIPAGTYTLALTQPDGATTQSALPIIFQIGAPILTTKIILPNPIGRHIASTIYVQYSNTGTASMPAPLLILGATNPSGLQGAYLSLDQTTQTSGFWTSAVPAGYSQSIQILASGATPGILQPGESVQVPVYYAGWNESQWDFVNTTLNFTLRDIESDNATAANWSALESTLEPKGTPDAAWHIMYSSLLPQLGTTSGGYVRVLDAAATYLGRLGQNVTDVSKLWRFMVMQTANIWPAGTLGSTVDDNLPTPGAIHLQFSRAFNQSIPGRFRFGPFGYGWTIPWQESLSIGADGTVTVTGESGATFTYQPDSRNSGQFFSEVGDHSSLTQDSDASFVLTAVDGTITTFSPSGTLNTIEDQNGNKITASYKNGNLVNLVSSSGQTFALSYNPSGLVSALTDSAGRVTSYTYDSSNRFLISVVSYTNQTTYYNYNSTAGTTSQNALTSINRPDNTHQYFTYNSEGKLASRSMDGGALSESFVYLDGQVSMSDSASNTGTIYFDQNGQRSKVSDALGNPTYFSHDNAFNLVKVVNALGGTATIAYNDSGQITNTQDFLGNSTTISYVPQSNKVSSITDPNQNTTLYNYDGALNLIQTQFCNGQHTKTTFDPLGGPISFLTASGQSIQISRNSAGQISSEAFSDGTTYSYSYDNQGLLISATDQNGTTSITYNPASRRMTGITYPNNLSLTFAYDSGGRRISMTNQSGSITNYSYDSIGRLSGLSDQNNNLIVSYFYDQSGRIYKKANGNGTYSTFEYDANGRVTHLINFQSNGAINSRFDDSYNQLGLKISETTIDGVWAYTYDAGGQLIHATYRANPNSTSENQDLSFAYDAAGNRIESMNNGVATAYTVNNMNRYTNVGSSKFSYDSNGNLTSDGISTYTYDILNHLITESGPTTTTSNTFNALGVKVTSTTAGRITNYQIDPAGWGNVVGLYNQNGSTVANYHYGLGLVSKSTASVTEYFDFDLLGSVVGVSADSGQYLSTCSYLPFGVTASSSGTASDSYGYTGQTGCPTTESGLIAMRTRTYSPSVGRFLSSDSLGLLGGDLNLTRYANNNPVSFIDPSGCGSIIANIPGLIWVSDFKSGLDTVGSLSQADFGGVIGSFVGSLAGGDAGAWIGAAAGLGIGLLIPGVGPIVGTIVGSIIGEQIGQFVGGLAGDWVGHKLLDPPTGSGAGGDGGGNGTPGSSETGTPESDPPGTDEPGGSCPIPDPPGGNTDPGSTCQTVEAQDPNALYGPAGYGSLNYLSDGTTTFPYQITFENSPTASAPAQSVTITNSLDPNLDWSTFQLTGIGFGDNNFTIPAGSQHYQKTMSMTYNGDTFLVEMEAGIHSQTGQVYATFQSLNGDSGLPPSNVLTGFLPPENGTGRGEGYVSYTISPKAGLPTGTVIPNVANVVFDSGVSIATDQISETDPSLGVDPAKQAQVTIDSSTPTSGVTALPSTTNTASFVVSWSGADVGSGITGYDLYVEDNGGPWTLWLSNTAATTGTYLGQGGHTYGFYAVARDGAGNAGLAPSATSLPQSETTVTATPVVVTQPANLGVIAGQSASFTVGATGSAPLTYSWQLEATGSTTWTVLSNSTDYSGTALATLTVISPVVAMDGDQFRCVVTGPSGSITSNSALLGVTDAQAIHYVAGGGYFAGGPAMISNTLTYSGTLTGLTWQVVLPPGWSYASGTGSEGDIKPAPGTTSLLEWTWSAPPPSPIVFQYQLNVPTGVTGNQPLSAIAIPQPSGLPVQTLVNPSPLTASAALTYHTADQNQDGKISLLELTRVIEIYNTRNGSSRTGAYVQQTGTEDGFAPDPNRTTSSPVILDQYHSADENQDSRINLLELTRVIELYNYRSGALRTGQYHAQAGTEDGFAPGP